MWRAVTGCDHEYDSKFFYAVKTVGVYCRPSCRSRTPLRKNVLFFESAAEAESAGYRPCKRCRPDLPEYEPSAELAERLKALIDANFLERGQLLSAAEKLGISQSRLAAVFRQRYNAAPAEYLNKKRAEYAKNLLATTEIPIIEVAAEVGFESLSAFYSFFRKHTGTSPKKYRVSAKPANK